MQSNVPVYADPSDATQGRPAKRWLGWGYMWVSIEGATNYEGQDFYVINPGEYVKAEALSVYSPSTFQGVALGAQPERPFAWILKPLQPSRTPLGEINPEAPVYQRYDLVRILPRNTWGARCGI